jgi:hypothetical protein
MTASTTQPKTRHRSPAYPAFDLKRAIDKARRMYEEHKRAAPPVDTLKGTLGYGARTSRGLRAISALIQFGLIEKGGEDGAGFRLSEVGLNILLRRDDDPVRLERIRAAAAGPALYKKIAERWKEALPEEREIANFLLFDLRFNPEAVPGIIRAIRSTWDFAGMIADPDGRRPAPRVATNDSPAHGQGPGGPTPPYPAECAVVEGTAPPDARAYTMPLARGRRAVLHVPADITADELALVERYVGLMREAIE